MKKVFLSVFALTAILTSCKKEESSSGSGSGEECTPELTDGALVYEKGTKVDISTWSWKDANLTSEEISSRKKKWINPKPLPEKGVLAKYARTVKSASEGAVTD